jgi:rare lipoprotein A
MSGQDQNQTAAEKLAKLRQPRVTSRVPGNAKLNKINTFGGRNIEQASEDDIRKINYDLSKEHILNNVAQFIVSYGTFGASSNGVIQTALNQELQRAEQEYADFTSQNELNEQQAQNLAKFRRIFEPEFEAEIIRVLFTPRQFQSGSDRLIFNNSVITEFLREVDYFVSNANQQQISSSISKGLDLAKAIQDGVEAGINVTQQKWGVGADPKSGQSYFSQVHDMIYDQFISKYLDDLIKQYDRYVPKPEDENQEEEKDDEPKDEKHEEKTDEVGDFPDENKLTPGSEKDGTKDTNSGSSDQDQMVAPGTGQLNPLNPTNQALNPNNSQTETQNPGQQTAQPKSVENESDDERRQKLDQMSPEEKARVDQEMDKLDNADAQQKFADKYGSDDKFVNDHLNPQNQGKSFKDPDSLDTKDPKTDFSKIKDGTDRVGQKIASDKEELVGKERKLTQLASDFDDKGDTEYTDRAKQRLRQVQSRIGETQNGTERVQKVFDKTSRAYNSHLNNAKLATTDEERNLHLKKAEKSRKLSEAAQKALNPVKEEAAEALGQVEKNLINTAIKELVAFVSPLLEIAVPILFFVCIFLTAMIGVLYVYCKPITSVRDPIEAGLLATNVGGTIVQVATGNQARSALRIALEDSGICKAINPNFCSTSNPTNTATTGSTGNYQPGTYNCQAQKFNNITVPAIPTDSSFSKAAFYYLLFVKQVESGGDPTQKANACSGTCVGLYQLPVGEIPQNCQWAIDSGFITTSKDQCVSDYNGGNGAVQENVQLGRLAKRQNNTDPNQRYADAVSKAGLNPSLPTLGQLQQVETMIDASGGTWTQGIAQAIEAIDIQSQAYGACFTQDNWVGGRPAGAPKLTQNQDGIALGSITKWDEYYNTMTTCTRQQNGRPFLQDAMNQKLYDTVKAGCSGIAALEDTTPNLDNSDSLETAKLNPIVGNTTDFGVSKTSGQVNEKQQTDTQDTDQISSDSSSQSSSGNDPNTNLNQFFAALTGNVNTYAAGSRPTSYSDISSDSKYMDFIKIVAQATGDPQFKDAGSVNSEALAALKKMQAAYDAQATSSQAAIMNNIVSGYRGPDEQVQTYFTTDPGKTNIIPDNLLFSDDLTPGSDQYNAVLNAYKARGEQSAVPGFSEHMTGLAFDIGSVNKATWQNNSDYQNLYAWLQKNASTYHFTQSYPESRGTRMEYWHWRYDGTDPSTKLIYSDIIDQNGSQYYGAPGTNTPNSASSTNNSCQCTNNGSTSTSSTTSATGQGTVTRGGDFTPEVDAFLDVVAKGEVKDWLGTSGYFEGNYGGSFTVDQAKQGYPGPVGGGIQVGRYQFSNVDYTDAKNADPQITDFLPPSQDRIGLYKLKYRKVLTPLMAGDLPTAFTNGSAEWESMVGIGDLIYTGNSKYQGQKDPHGRTLQDEIDLYNQRLQYYKSLTSGTQSYLQINTDTAIADSNTTDTNILDNLNPFQSITANAASTVGQTYTGKSSFYTIADNDPPGSTNTASGIPLDDNKYTAALLLSSGLTTSDIPFKTMVKVTNTDNNKSVVVEITDTGAGGTGRLIDLTKVAFAAIGDTNAGLINVSMQVVDPSTPAGPTDGSSTPSSTSSTSTSGSTYDPCKCVNSTSTPTASTGSNTGSAGANTSIPNVNTKYLTTARTDLAGGNSKKFLIVHFTGTGASNTTYTVDQMAAEFKRRAENKIGGYVHFVTGENGEIYQILPDDYKSGGALGGIIKNGQFNSTNSNATQIEMHYDPTLGEGPSDAMLKSTAAIASKYISDPTLLYSHWGTQPWNRSDVDWIHPTGDIDQNLLTFISYMRQDGAFNSGPWMSAGSDQDINLAIAKVITQNNIQNALDEYADPTPVKDKASTGDVTTATLQAGLQKVGQATGLSGTTSTSSGSTSTSTANCTSSGSGTATPAGTYKANPDLVKAIEYEKSIGGLGLHTCYATVIRAIRRVGFGSLWTTPNYDNPGGTRLDPALDVGGTDYNINAIDFATFMNLPGNLQKYGITDLTKAGITDPNDPRASGDINVKTDDGRFLNYGDMTPWMKVVPSSEVAGIYVAN